MLPGAGLRFLCRCCGEDVGQFAPGGVCEDCLPHLKSLPKPTLMNWTKEKP